MSRLGQLRSAQVRTEGLFYMRKLAERERKQYEEDNIVRFSGGKEDGNYFFVSSPIAYVMMKIIAKTGKSKIIRYAGNAYRLGARQT